MKQTAETKQKPGVTFAVKMSQQTFRDRGEGIIARLCCEVMPFPDKSSGDQEARLDRAAKDVMYFCRRYLPHYFSQLPAPFHYELVELLESRRVAGDDQEAGKPGPKAVIPVVVAAPREFAKSTLCAFGYVLHQICFKKRRFIILGSDTEDLASDLTGYIYLELLYNERLQQDFGVLVRNNQRVDDFVTTTDVRLKARGRNQRLRGLKHKQCRPDLVILDDLENDVNVRNPRIVTEILEWVKSAVYPAIDAEGSMMVIGTILKRKSALHQMLTSSEEPYKHFRRKIYRAIQDDGSSLWEARHPISRLRRQKQLMGTVAFNREKMNEPEHESGMFRQQWVHYYHPDSLKDKELIVCGFFDPSLETKASSDYKAIVTVGLDPREMVFFVLDALIQKNSLDAVLQSIFTRQRHYGYQAFGVEDNLFQRLLLREIERLSQEMRQLVPVRGVTHRVAKETRVAALSPLLERGKIRFIRGHSDQELLIEQLLYFPSPTMHDDGPDALEGAIRLAEANIVVDPGYAAVEKRVFSSRGGF